METNPDWSRLSQFGFFLLVLAYAVLLLTNLPPGEDAQRFPVIILPLLIVLVLIRLVNLLFPGLRKRFVPMRDRIGRSLNLFSSNSDSSSDLKDYQSSYGAEESDWRADLRNGVWIVGGVVAVYLVGLYVGGFVFTALYIYVRSEKGLLASLAVGLLFIVALFAISDTLSVRIWEGLYSLPLPFALL